MGEHGGCTRPFRAIRRPVSPAAARLPAPAVHAETLAAHEDMPRRYEAGMPRAEWEAWTRERAQPNADGVVERAVGERARRVRLPDIPVTILTASVRPDGRGWDARLLSQAARQVHASILRGVTVGRHLPAARSGPQIQLDEPDLVTEEILRLERMGR